MRERGVLELEVERRERDRREDEHKMHECAKPGEMLKYLLEMFEV